MTKREINVKKRGIHTIDTINRKKREKNLIQLANGYRLWTNVVDPGQLWPNPDSSLEKKKNPGSDPAPRKPGSGSELDKEMVL